MMKVMRFSFFIALFVWSIAASASLLNDLQLLKRTYSEYIKAVNSRYITWSDGTKMPVQGGKLDKSWQEKLDAPSLADQLEQDPYIAGKPKNLSTYHPHTDPGRIRYEPFFSKMYGGTPSMVKSRLTTIYWMPKFFGKRYPLQVTTVNSVDKKMEQVSEELEELVVLHPDFLRYLKAPAGFFQWRTIAESKRLSPHSYGIALDLNGTYSNYWQWELQKHGLPVKESTPLQYINHIPWEIVLIFEKYGFIWGGKWYHFDTMHFEYRPDILRH
jgi:peptidoglycan L-alanyl-D-glutamate endopeptidase CwlK